MRDRRLILGAVLVLASTVLGAQLLGADDGSVTVWSARHDLAAGLVVHGDDLESRTVRLDHDTARYVSAAGVAPAAFVLTRPVGRGELLPAAAVAPAGTAADLRVVTVPVKRFHVADDLGSGERVDVYVTPRDESGASDAVLLAAGVSVVDVEADGGRFGGSGATRGIAVAVPARAVATLVGGLGGGTVDVVRVGSGAA